MTNIPADLSYTKDHEWARAKRGRLTVGITDYAQRQLGDIVYAELPKLGERLQAGEPFGSLESVKAVSEVYMPVSGSVIAVNGALNDAPEQVNEEPYEGGWLIVVEPDPDARREGLLTATEYENYLKEGADG